MPTGLKPPRKKVPTYKGHCAFCHRTRDTAGAFVRRRQGTSAPADMVITPCSAPHLPHTALCDTHGKQLHMHMRTGASALDAIAIMRGTDTAMPVSAVAALMDLSTTRAMDLDQALSSEPSLVDGGVNHSTDNAHMTDADPTPSTPTKTMKQKRRREDCESVLLKSGGTQRALLRTLLEPCTETVDGRDVLAIPNDRGPRRRYVHQPRARVGNDKACKRTIMHRINALSSHRVSLSHVSSVDEDANNKSEIQLIASEITQTPSKFEQAVINTDLLTPPSLSAHETTQLISIAGLTGSAFKKISSYVTQKCKRNVFASAKAVQKTISSIVHETESGYGTTPDSANIPYIRYKNIAQVLDDHVLPLIEAKNPHQHNGVLAKRTIKIAVLGDKGGNSTKLGVSVINKKKPQSRYSILPLAMYESDESYDFITEFMSKTIRDIEQWAADTVRRYKKWRIILMLGGDTYWLWDIMGLAHKGTYYCPLCECNINNPGQPHTEKQITKKIFHHRTHKKHGSQVITFTTINPNLKNLRGIQAKSETVKNCIRHSLVGQQLYEHVIPPILHIDLGIVKIIIEECEALAREKDLAVHINNLLMDETKVGEANKLRESLHQFIQSSKDVKKFKAEVEHLMLRKKNAEWGTKGKLDQLITNAKKSLREAEVENNKSIKIISTFEGEHINTVTAFIKSIQPKRKHNVGLRGAVVGSVADKMFEKKFISKLSLILNNGALNDLKQRADNIIMFMTQYAQVRCHMKSTNLLTNEHLNKISATCNWMGENFPMIFPERIISPKLHMLFIHIPRFAKQHKNLGLFSESAFESLHAEFNEYDRRFTNITDRLQSLETIWRTAELRRQEGFAEHTRIRRTCSSCGCEIAKDSVSPCQCKPRTRRNSAKKQKISDDSE
jgi:hypothetical protein